MSEIKSKVSLFKIMFFVLVFLFVGFFANMGTAQAAAVDNSGGEVPYTSYKTVYFLENGVFTTTVIIGCEAGSGDLYDMNTGKPCPNNKPVLIGCAPLSGDLYDVNTGKPCSNIVASVSKNSNIAIASEPEVKTSSNKLAVNIVSSAISTEKENTSGEELAQENTETTEESISGREKIGRSLSASVNKIGSIMSGPMSIWIILLIVAILLGGGYGIYNLIKKEDDKEVDSKEEVKVETKGTPATTTAPITPQTNNVTPQTNTVNISKTEGAVSTHSIAK